MSNLLSSYYIPWILAIATILGGVSAIFYFWDKIRGIFFPSEIKELKDAVLDAHRRVEFLQTGGDTFCYFMLYYFDLTKNISKNITLIKIGEYPLFDISMRICDMNNSKDILYRTLNTINSSAIQLRGEWSMQDKLYYRIFFHARNGSWHQDLILNKSINHGCWLAATKVINRNGDSRFNHIDHDFIYEFGDPKWRD